MAWLEEEPVAKILERLQSQHWGEIRVHEEAKKLSRPNQGKVTFVPFQKPNTSSAILNGLCGYPDITEKVFQHLELCEIHSLYHAVQPLRRLNKLGRLLPGLRELPYLGLNSWAEKARLLPPSRQCANNTDRPSRDAIDFMSGCLSWHMRKFLLCEDAAKIERVTYVKLRDSIMKGWLVKKLDRNAEASWRVARLADGVFQHIRLLERIRRRHEVADKNERERLMAEECALSDAIGERIDALRNGNFVWGCPVCFRGNLPVSKRGHHYEPCGCGT
ncbi:uncharacterized protein J3D65DRAFT_603342 [Phyllosticta citribraziliensis]|uniref:F-box domain-containing protein n=1 Tax=Phyllosticta citribraziliensis TaxID=989973 RepID=A0ABR1LQB3_9PEZI